MYATLIIYSCKKARFKKLESGIYYWEPTSEMLYRQGFSKHLVLSGEASYTGSDLQFKNYSIPSHFTEFVPVFRLNQNWYRASLEQKQMLAFSIKDWVMNKKSEGFQIRKIQLDYDVQKHSLPHYHSLIKFLLDNIPDVAIEVTLLVSRMDEVQKWVPENAQSICIMYYDVNADNWNLQDDLKIIEDELKGIKQINKPLSHAIPSFSMLRYKTDQMEKWSIQEPDSLTALLQSHCNFLGDSRYTVSESFMLDGKWYAKGGEICIEKYDYAHLLALVHLLSKYPIPHSTSIYIFSDNAYSRNVLPYGLPDSVLRYPLGGL